MRYHPCKVIAVATAVSLLGPAVAQGNDDCSGAISVSQGANGPYSNAGSTTSSPGWPCALGGNDVWYIYVAPGAGSLTVDTCGSTFDTALQLFDGSNGCAALTNLACNDDSCGLQSSITVPVAIADTIYIRVGGFASQTGSFTLNISGPPPSGTVALSTAYGMGCVAEAGSMYEFMPSGSFDLNGQVMSMLPLLPGYIAIGLGTYVAPSAAATVLQLSDDSETAVTLTAPFPYDGGATSSLTVCSNGFVSIASGNGTSYTPNVGTLLSAPQTGWWCWHDYNPAASGGGQVKFEEIGPIAYITWDGVLDYGSQSPNTWQMQFDTATGTVNMAWQQMSTQGNAFLVGYSPGGPSMDPGSTDISMELPSAIVIPGNDVQPLALSTSARPIANTTIQMITDNITASAPFGGVAFGLNNPNLNLASIGMDGCTQYADQLAVVLFFPNGATSVQVPFAVPNAVGVTFLAQSFAYDPGVANTTLGAIASNGRSLFVGTL